jgi:hypothetical protein
MFIVKIYVWLSFNMKLLSKIVIFLGIWSISAGFISQSLSATDDIFYFFGYLIVALILFSIAFILYIFSDKNEK